MGGAYATTHGLPIAQRDSSVIPGDLSRPARINVTSDEWIEVSMAIGREFGLRTELHTQIFSKAVAKAAFHASQTAP